MKMYKRTNVYKFMGMVSEVRRHKAIVSFGLNGCHEHAILKADKLFLFGNRQSENLTEILSVGMVITFSAHTLSQVSEENCAWYIYFATTDCVSKFDGRIGCIQKNAEFILPLRFHVGRVDHLNDRNGAIECYDNSGATSLVFFCASKFYIHGSNFDANGKLNQVLDGNDLLHFDAIPCIPLNNITCSEWNATLVWIGRRPRVKEINCPTEVNFREFIQGYKFRWFIRQLCNANALYVKAEGRVMFLINHEFGVALLMIRPNVLQTALFHRNDTFSCGRNMRDCDLRKVLKEGDALRFIGVQAPKGVLTRFVAYKIHICKF
ncbi:uncharacterized protein LOC134529767 [Bacillus rossius redtenbacheri]|uniref:uncharacterized protein LOC134529767 n=1 Tax=Bacillus rossius redtenbacheri TaxID=93214 RepID=UPI002FDE6DB9